MMKSPEYNSDDYLWFAAQMSLLVDYHFAQDPSEYLRSLPKWQSQLFHVGNAVTAIMNGGMDGYLTGSHVGHIDDVIHILQDLKAEEMLKTLIGFKGLFPHAMIPLDYDERLKCIDQICADKNVSKIDDVIEVVIDDEIWAMIKTLEP